MGTTREEHAMAKVSVVKVAIGVVLVLLVIKACDRYGQGQAIKQAGAGITQLVDSFSPVPTQTRAQRESETEQREHGRKLEREPLQADERCIDGQRFRRAANGWVQNGSC
jgi:hypothetical protein